MKKLSVQATAEEAESGNSLDTPNVIVILAPENS